MGDAKGNVLPCPRREAELIGEVAQRDGGVRATAVADYEAKHQAPTPSRLRRTSPINYAALREQGKIICCHHTVILMLLIGSASA